MAGFEGLTAGPDSPSPMGINGAPGRIASRLFVQSFERGDFLPVIANTRTGTLDKRWDLATDKIYSSTGFSEVEAVSLEQLHLIPRKPDSVNGAITVRTPKGDRVAVIGSNSATSDGIDWYKLEKDYTGPGVHEVVDSMRYMTVFDASTLKVEKGSNGQNRSPEGRHPGAHLDSGARLVVITSPFNVDNSAYHPKHRVETVIAGVNDDPTNLQALLGEGVRCFSASSCTTGALMNLLKAIQLSGASIKSFDATVLHSNTESDDGLTAMDSRPSGSGSLSEVNRLLPSIGLKLGRSEVGINVYRVPVAVGSLITARVLLDDVMINSFVEDMRDGVSSAGLSRRIGFTDHPVSAFSIREDRRTVTIENDVTLQKRGRRVMATFRLGFQNETGYADGVLDLGAQLVSTLRGMDEAGETK